MDDKSGPPPSYTETAASPQQYPGQMPYPPQSTQQPYMLEQQHQQAPSYYPQQQYNPYPPQDQKQPIGQYPAGQQYPQQYSASNTTVVSQQPGIVQQMPMHVESYTFLSWFACLFCCWPVGIAAIIKSSEVNSSLANGDYGRAQRASMDAKKYAIIAIVCGLILLPLIIVLNVIRVSSQTY